MFRYALASLNQKQIQLSRLGLNQLGHLLSLRTQVGAGICTQSAGRQSTMSHSIGVADAKGNSHGHIPARAFTSASADQAPVTDLVTAEDVMGAYERIRGIVAKSPLDYSTRFSELTGSRVYIKKEHATSSTGSYKERGALNKLLQLSDEERRRGVICSSAGNHAQAVSYHATRLGIDAVICMPTTTPHVKVKNTAAFGGRVVIAGESFGEAYAFARRLCDHENRTFIHAFDDPMIVAGAGTVAVEMMEQNPFLDAIVVPVGGGGLIAGMATFIKNVNPRIKVYGVEAAQMPGMYESLKHGHVVAVPKHSTMADGIAIERIGQTPFDLIKKYVDDIVLVKEDEIAEAVLNVLELEKTLVEGSGATGLAALVSNKLPQLKGKKVGVVCTGSNIDINFLGRIIEKGLVKSGRLARIRVLIKDIPGQLARICSICTELRVNIVEIRHERAFLLDTVGVTQPIFDVEVRGFDHIDKLVDRLTQEGFETHVVTPYH